MVSPLIPKLKTLLRSCGTLSWVVLQMKDHSVIPFWMVLTMTRKTTILLDTQLLVLNLESSMHQIHRVPITLQQLPSVLTLMLVLAMCWPMLMLTLSLSSFTTITALWQVPASTGLLGSITHRIPHQIRMLNCMSVYLVALLVHPLDMSELMSSNKELMRLVLAVV